MVDMESLLGVNAYHDAVSNAAVGSGKVSLNAAVFLVQERCRPKVRNLDARSIL